MGEWRKPPSPSDFPDPGGEFYSKDELAKVKAQISSLSREEAEHLKDQLLEELGFTDIPFVPEMVRLFLAKELCLHRANNVPDSDENPHIVGGIHRKAAALFSAWVYQELIGAGWEPEDEEGSEFRQGLMLGLDLGGQLERLAQERGAVGE